MPEDIDLEGELLRRFQALKSTPTDKPGDPSSFRATSDEQARRAKEEDDELERIADGRLPTVPTSTTKSTEDDELKRRMAGLRGIETEEEPVAADDDDAEVEAFIASLSSARPPETVSSPDTNPDSSRIGSGRGLEKEARDILRLTNRHLDLKGRGGPDNDEESEGEELDDLETEDDIIQRAIDESRSGIGPTSEDEGAGPQSPGEPKVVKKPPVTKEKADQLKSRPDPPPELSFPSLPTHAPIDDNEEPANSQDPDMEARMARLLGLSGPSTLPGPSLRLPSPPKEVKRAPGQGWNLPGYKDDRDDDPDSWCCICNKDADVICLGCDNDPYCEGCWMEGHVGERHRTKRFAGTGGKKAIGA